MNFPPLQFVAVAVVAVVALLSFRETLSKAPHHQQLVVYLPIAIHTLTQPLLLPFFAGAGAAAAPPPLLQL